LPRLTARAELYCSAFTSTYLCVVEATVGIRY
jgi:hypothetical protein